MKLRHALIGIPVIAAVTAGGWLCYRYSSVHPSTSDAYLGRHVVHITAQVSGPIESVLVHNNQAIKRGDLMLTIDMAPFELAVNRAEAQLQQAKEALAAADARVNAAQAQIASAQANADEAARHAHRIRRAPVAPARLGCRADRDRRGAGDGVDHAARDLAAAGGSVRLATLLCRSQPRGHEYWRCDPNAGRHRQVRCSSC